jgi:hypothetical protein
LLLLFEELAMIGMAVRFELAREVPLNAPAVLGVIGLVIDIGSSNRSRSSGRRGVPVELELGCSGEYVRMKIARKTVKMP